MRLSMISKSSVSSAGLLTTPTGFSGSDVPRKPFSVSIWSNRCCSLSFASRSRVRYSSRQKFLSLTRNQTQNAKATTTKERQARGKAILAASAVIVGRECGILRGKLRFPCRGRIRRGGFGVAADTHRFQVINVAAGDLAERLVSLVDRRQRELSADSRFPPVNCRDGGNECTRTDIIDQLVGLAQPAADVIAKL